jgi:hypothetical protein
MVPPVSRILLTWFLHCLRIHRLVRAMIRMPMVNSPSHGCPIGAGGISTEAKPAAPIPIASKGRRIVISALEHEHCLLLWQVGISRKNRPDEGWRGRLHRINGMFAPMGEQFFHLGNEREKKLRRCR